MEAKKEILEALRKLGYKVGAEVISLSPIDKSRVVVFIKGKQFGIYDLDRRTFVD